ncbi:Acetyltransferase (GNAT) family protein [compost metagenome]
MTEAVKRGDVFAFREEGKSEWAGMMILQWNPSSWDHRLWGNEDGFLEDAVYIHRVVVNRAYAGTGLGSAMLKWAETGASYPGKKWLRLDCIASNEALNRFYPACGYQFVREADGFHLYDLLLSAS